MKWLLLFVLLPGFVWADDIQVPERFVGEFTQDKTLKRLKRPLKSTGQVIFDRQLGLVWKTLTPIKSTSVITPSQIIQIGPGGERQVLSNQASIGELMLALFSGEVESLSTSFAVEPQDKGCIKLTAKQEQIALVAQTASVCQQQNSQTLVLKDKWDNLTRIELVLSEVKSLTPEQGAWFK